MKYPKLLLETKHWGECVAYSEDGFKQKTIEMIRNGYDPNIEPDWDVEWDFVKGSDGLYTYDSQIGEDHDNIDPYSIEYLSGEDVDSVYIQVKIVAKATWNEKFQYWKMEEVSRTEKEIPQWT
jgi:hypothetical protein